jgi:hypothetical protein
LLKDKVAAEIKIPLLMDRAYKSDERRKLARDWDYDRQLYKERNKIGRLFMRIK